jgi:DNA polymerase-3 subunit alpha
MTYTPLHVHTHYSLQSGLSQPKNIIERCKQLNINTCAITDTGVLSGTVSFYKELTKNKIKPLLGCELNLCFNDATNKSESNTKLGKITLLCRSLQGWKDLIKLVSTSNTVEYFHNSPRLDLNKIQSLIHENSLVCITGYYDSYLWHLITSENELVPNWEDVFNEHIKKLYNIFGKENVFIELQMFDNIYNKYDIGLQIRQLCNKHSYKLLAGIDSYYCESSDSADHKVLICSGLKTTLPELSRKVISNKNTGVNHFFESDKYCILSYEDMQTLYEPEEINNTNKVAEMCEEFSPLSKHVLPEFDYPNTFTNDAEYLRHLCRQGWVKKINPRFKKEEQTAYIDRIKYELEVLETAGLSSYFLIIQDILQYAKNNNWLCGPGRGSAAGCLVSYLIGITSATVDPIEYNLLFERFYNSGRNTKDRISMPDIDVDIPINHRDTIIQYIKDKYGVDRVSQMITFTTLKGRGALKEVLRVHANVSFEEMNAITKHIPNEATIADELQDIKEEEGHASIIKWALENEPDKFKEWCEINENGELVGPLAKRFEQAIRMEGVKIHQSRHAAGVAISASPLYELCPMIYDPKSDQYLAGLEMNDLDALGIIKFDILGIALLDKMMFINTLIKETKNATI